MIWVIGGTKDSRDFLEKFIKYDKDIIVSTATEYGAKLIENLPVKTSSEKMDKEAMLKFVENNNITKVIDTSHPYAFEVSKNAMEVAEEKNIEYFRFEREEVDFLKNNGAYSIGLGARILRTETAGINLLSILQYEFM